MKLFEIDNAIANFEFDIDEFTGEILNTEELDALQMARDAKIENIALYIKEMDAEAKALKEEIGNLTERMKAKENKRDGLKRYLQNALAGQKFESAKCKISYRTSKQVVLAEEFDEWAKENAPDLLVTTTTVKPDKTAIKDAINNGRKVEGATLVQNSNIQIK